MPDWSYHPLFKSLLFRMPGTMGREFIHKGMNIIANLPGGPSLIEFLGHMKPSLYLQKTLFGLSFSNPVGLSGRIDPQLSGTKAFSNLGFGFIEIGPVTLEAQHPNVAPTYDRKGQNILHFVIGYTTFLHLFPAYFALFLFLVGIICSKDYLCKKEGVPNE